MESGESESTPGILLQSLAVFSYTGLPLKPGVR